MLYISPSMVTDKLLKSIPLPTSFNEKTKRESNGTPPVELKDGLRRVTLGGTMSGSHSVTGANNRKTDHNNSRRSPCLVIRYEPGAKAKSIVSIEYHA